MEYQLIKLNTARNSLRYIIKAFNIKEIYVPYYVCPVIRSAINKENCKINYYHIDINFKPIEDFPLNAYILYPNYFGVCSDIVDELCLKYKNLIVDNAHSFFCEPKGIASFNSLRKFFDEVRDGSFLYIKSEFELSIEKDVCSYNQAKMTDEEFILNENRLDNEDLKIISDCTLKIYENIDLEKKKIQIKNNFNNVHNVYKNGNQLKLNIKDTDYPFKYPLLVGSVERANEIVLDLNKDGINIYRYWNNLPDDYIEKAFYERLIAI